MQYRPPGWYARGQALALHRLSLRKEYHLDRALWITWYDLSDGRNDAYLSWLHESYIPRLLSKPGFLWATHFASVEVTSGARNLRHVDAAMVPDGNDYVLLFGAESPHVFADPVPGKLHATLPPADRKMLAARRGERSGIFVEEARVTGPEAASGNSAEGLAPCIQLGSFNAGSWKNEEDLLEWYARCRMTAMQTLPGCLGVRKLVSVSGWAKHGVLYEFSSLEARNAHFPEHEKNDPEKRAWSDRLVPTLIHAPGSPNVATRLWPPVR